MVQAEIHMALNRALVEATVMIAMALNRAPVEAMATIAMAPLAALAVD